jgi:hypothetical protein
MIRWITVILIVVIFGFLVSFGAMRNVLPNKQNETADAVGLASEAKKVEPANEPVLFFMCSFTIKTRRKPTKKCKGARYHDDKRTNSGEVEIRS